MAMRGFILALVAGLTPLAVQAQTTGLSALFARQALEASGGSDTILSGLRELAQSMANGYAAGARETNQPLDQQALDRAVKHQIAAYRMQFLDASAREWSRRYTADELSQMLAAQRSRTAARRDLMAKMPSLNGQDTEVLASLAPKLYRDIFVEYCSASPCTENTKKRIAQSASN